MGQKRKMYSKEFKEQAVFLSETSGKSVREIVHDLGISENILWRWKRKHRESGDKSFPGQGNRQPGNELEEKIRKLEEELYTVKMERDILKKRWPSSHNLRSKISNRRPQKGLIHHSDRGMQYACNSYRRLLRRNHFVCSMSRKGNCWDNSPAESFFNTLKIECIKDQIFLTRAQAKQEIFEYIEIDYNRKRSHSSIGYMSPENFEKLRLSA